MTQERITIDRDIPVEMRDGVVLATDVYRPPGDEEHPTLVHRIPYDKDNAQYVGSLVFNPLNAAQRGYAVVVQDTRGRFNSEGEWQPFHGEAEDGYDTVEWAAERSWSDGNVGIYGSSYMGITTWQTVVSDPPHLEAALAYLTTGNNHDGAIYSGGAFELGFALRWTLAMAWNTLERRDLSQEEFERARNAMMQAAANPRDAVKHLPLRDHPAFRNGIAQHWTEWHQHPSYDDYWEAVDVTRQIENVSVPVLHVGGWYDQFLRGHLDVHEAIEEHGDERVREEQRFIIGPWDHGAYLSSTPTSAGERVFGPIAPSGRAFMSDLTLQWFDHWLKGTDTGAETIPPVRYFQMGDDEWREADAWPPDHTPIQQYFHSDGNANSRTGDGILTGEQPSVPESPDSYRYDPSDPVPSCGGLSLIPNLSPGGVQDRSGVEEREDVLVYTTPHLTSNLSIAGPVDVTLCASSSTPDTDFTAKLVDVQPDGYCAPIADGILRARYRNSMEQPEFVEPGNSYTFDIDLWAVAHTFRSGHRLRVEISSSDFPRFDRNLNTNKPLGEAVEADMQTATQRVFHDPDGSSHITLPVIEGAEQLR